MPKKARYSKNARFYITVDPQTERQLLLYAQSLQIRPTSAATKLIELALMALQPCPSPVAKIRSLVEASGA